MVVLVSITVSVQAASTGIRTFYIDEAALGETGYKIESQWDESGIPTAWWDDGTPLDIANAPQGFELLDGTLHITTSIPNGQMKLQVRIQYDPDSLRAKGGRRAKPPILLRRKRVARVMRWRPITDIMGVRGLRARRKRGPATFELGHYGTDWTNDYVWAVADVPGTFAIGVPEPVSLLCVAGGIGVLMLRRPKRRACK